MPKRFSLCLVSAMLALQAHAGTAVGNSDWYLPAGSGGFSAAAHGTCEAGPDGTSGHDVPAPDGRRTIAVHPGADGDTTFTLVDERGRQTAIDTAAWPCPEIGWSAGSDQVFVNYSEGGAVGTFEVAVYRIAGGKTDKIDIATAARRDFQRRYPKCFEPETPNVAAIAWSGDGSRLMLAAQVLPHSNCDDMGTFTLYEVMVPGGAIVRRIPQLAAKASFKRLLGPELRGAEDRCFSQPGSCRIPALHAPPERRPR